MSLPWPFGIQQVNTSPLVNPPQPLKDLIDQNNQIQSSRVINPITQDYELNSNGTFVGQSVVQTSVYLALFTTFNSSAVSGLGNQFLTLGVITPNIEKKVFNLTQQALASLINQGLVALVSCSVSAVNDSVTCDVNWQDLTQNSAGQKTFTTNLLLSQ
jgi:phage gp46-like protein